MRGETETFLRSTATPQTPVLYDLQVALPPSAQRILCLIYSGIGTIFVAARQKAGHVITTSVFLNPLKGKKNVMRNGLSIPNFLRPGRKSSRISAATASAENGCRPLEKGEAPQASLPPWSLKTVVIYIAMKPRALARDAADSHNLGYLPRYAAAR